jgi:hypothetical protein
MWPPLGNLVIGLWLMSSPAVLGYSGHAALCDHIIGPIVASVSTMVIWEVLRSLRWLNFMLGAWLLISPWILVHDTVETVNHSLAGILVMVFASVRGNRQHRFGDGWAALWTSRGKIAVSREEQE